DEVQFYKAALDAQGVLDLFNSYTVVASEQLVSQWNLDDGSGNTATDTADGNNGTLLGGLDATGWSSDCISGSCLDFDGVDDHINLYEPENLAITGALTISYWMKPDNAQAFGTENWKGLVDRCAYTGSQGGWGILGFATTNKLAFGLDPDTVAGGNYLMYSNQNTWTPGQWYHVVATFDGTTDPDNMKLYIDGALDNSDTFSSATTLGGPDCDLSIGASGRRYSTPTAGSYFDGSIDEVEIRNYALTPAEVLAAYEADAPASEQLVSEWNLDGNANDSVGTNNGTITGATVTSGCIDGSDCLSFDGVDDYINIPNSSSLNPSTDISVSTWVKMNDLNGSYVGIVSKYDADYDRRQYYVGRCDTGKFVFVTSSNGVNHYGVTTVNSYSLDTWYHIVGALDSGSTQKIYVDGIEVSTTADACGFANSEALPTSLAVTDAPLHIGKRTASPNFNGLIDEARIYDYALDGTEINALYSSYSLPVSEELVSQWDFNEGSGSTLTDSISGHNGTLLGDLSTTGWSTDCVEGNCLTFDGAGDYIELGDVADVKLQEFTLTTWFKLSALGKVQHLFHQGYRAARNGFQMRIWNNDRFNVAVMSTATGEVDLYGTTALETDTWYHGTFVVNNGTMQMYLNGALEGTKTYTGLVDYDGATQDFNLGADLNGSNPLNGQMDKAGVYNYALDASEVLAAYEADAPSDPCGNGTIDAGESCDDGNTTAGDGCSDTCQIECGIEINATNAASFDSDLGTAGTQVVLTQDYECTASQFVYINNSDTTLDCASHSITGVLYGVKIGRNNNVTIENCQIHDTQRPGISGSLYTNTGLVIRNNTLTNTHTVAVGSGSIWIDYANNITVENNTINSTLAGSGIYFSRVTSSQITGNNVSGTAAGIYLAAASTGNTLTNNTVLNNSVDINDLGSNNTGTNNSCKVVNNYADQGQPAGCNLVWTGIPECGNFWYDDVTLTQDYDCTSNYALTVADSNMTLDCNGHSISGYNYGIGVGRVNNATVRNCVVHDNKRTGISVATYNNSGIVIENNTLTDNSTDNGQHAIWVDYANNVTIQNNTITNSIYRHISGILLNRVTDSLVTGNNVSKYAQGLAINALSSNNTVTDNVFLDNSNYDINNSSTVYTADNNVCGVVNNWADDGQTSGCDFDSEAPPVDLCLEPGELPAGVVATYEDGRVYLTATVGVDTAAVEVVGSIDLSTADGDTHCEVMSGYSQALLDNFDFYATNSYRPVVAYASDDELQKVDIYDGETLLYTPLLYGGTCSPDLEAENVLLAYTAISEPIFADGTASAQIACQAGEELATTMTVTIDSSTVCEVSFENAPAGNNYALNALRPTVGSCVEIGQTLDVGEFADASMTRGLTNNLIGSIGIGYDLQLPSLRVVDADIADGAYTKDSEKAIRKAIKAAFKHMKKDALATSGDTYGYVDITRVPAADESSARVVFGGGVTYLSDETDTQTVLATVEDADYDDYGLEGVIGGCLGAGDYSQAEDGAYATCDITPTVVDEVQSSLGYAIAASLLADESETLVLEGAVDTTVAPTEGDTAAIAITQAFESFYKLAVDSAGNETG
ncbi:LamG-like jellyroll fold domain-containing protein, partial [Patescibacteria group bacterium]